jgi:hypothetical protein
MPSPSYVPVIPTGRDVAFTGSLTAAGLALPSGEVVPADHGYSAWTGDPESIQAATALVSGTVYLRKLRIRRAITPTVLAFSVSVAATGVVAGQNFAGLYDSDGGRLATVGIDAAIASSGVTEVAIAPGALAAASFVWAAIVVNATGAPQLHRMSSTTTPPNANLSAAVLRNAVNGVGQTSLPASITPASNSGTGAITWWGALR